MTLPLNQILLGDCLEVMKTLPDGCVDALITDPPYSNTDLKWDKKIDLAAFWVEANRVCKENATMAIFAVQPFTTDVIVSNRKAFRYDLVWQKTSPVGFLDANLRQLRAHETILVFCRKYRGAKCKKLYTYNPQKTKGTPYKTNGTGVVGHYIKPRINTVNTGERFPTSVLTYSNRTGGKSLHPTQKPLDLLQNLVRTYTNPSDLILDPYAGSGSTCHAALLENRNYIGVELDADYHTVAAQRIATARESVA